MENKNFEIHNLKTIIEKFNSELLERKESPAIKFNVKFLDKYLRGLRKGQMYVLGARPSVGKTTFALNIINNLIHSNLKDNEYILFISLEMSLVDIYMKLLSMNSALTVEEIEQGFLSQAKTNHINKIMDQLANKNLLMVESNGFSDQDLKFVINQIEITGKKVKSVFVDYIQLMELKGSEARNEKLAKTSKNLRVLAKQKGFNIFLLSQLTRDYEKRLGTKPNLSDLKDTGAIEQDADAVLFLWESKKNSENEVEEKIVNLSISKNRNGNIHEGKLNFKLNYGIMEEK